MGIVIDSTGWNLKGWDSHRLTSALEDLLDRLDHAFSYGRPVWTGDDLQVQAVYEDLDLWRLRDSDSPIRIDDNIWQELAAALGQTKRYVDEDEWPAGFDDFAISVNAEPPQENPDVAWAHHNVRNGKAVACLGLTLKGIFSTTSVKDTVSIHWVSDSQSYTSFWRDAIEIERDCPATLERLSANAYPGLFFANGVWQGLKNLSGGYFAHSAELRRYLSVLSDDGVWAFTAPPPAMEKTEVQGTSEELPTSQLIIRRFNRLKLNVTPENPNVYQNFRCRSAREIMVLGKNLYCEWHGKLQEYQNRVHIHAPILGTEGKLIIGIIDSHLPLP